MAGNMTSGIHSMIKWFLITGRGRQHCRFVLINFGKEGRKMWFEQCHVFVRLNRIIHTTGELFLNINKAKCFPVNEKKSLEMQEFRFLHSLYKWASCARAYQAAVSQGTCYAPMKDSAWTYVTVPSIYFSRNLFNRFFIHFFGKKIGV